MFAFNEDIHETPNTGLKQLLTCDECQELLQSPCKLKCERSKEIYRICQKHIQKHLAKSNFIKCRLCKAKHKYKKEEIVEDTQLKALISSYEASGYKGVDEVEYAITNLVKEAKGNVTIYQAVEMIPTTFIERYFNFQSMDLDEKLEILKINIELNLEKIKQSVESTRQKCLDDFDTNLNDAFGIADAKTIAKYFKKEVDDIEGDLRELDFTSETKALINIRIVKLKHMIEVFGNNYLFANSKLNCPNLFDFKKSIGRYAFYIPKVTYFVF